MATLPRQPFAPLDGARLQSLTSLKNRQNAFSPSHGKRKADSIDTDDSENIDPTLFSKRSKGVDFFSATSKDSKDYLKPSAFFLTKASSTPSFSNASATPPTPGFSKLVSSSRPRNIIQPKSPAARLNTSLANATPLSAPAGRSPTRGNKQIGIFSNRRRTASPFTRLEPPVFNLGGRAGAAPFSLDAALKGTISSYASRNAVAPATAASSTPSSLLCGSSSSDLDASSWNFDIHEDTPEQEMTNLLQHSTCVLDISSDEESQQRASRERAEGRDKENIPPADDVSQTTSAAARARAAAGEDDMVVEKARGPLVEMNPADYYPDGCDGTSVIIVPEDEEYDDAAAAAAAAAAPQHLQQQLQEQHLAPDETARFESAPELNIPAVGSPAAAPSIDELMGNRRGPAPQAALFEPIEGTGETFELWESGSAKDEAEVAAPPSPSPVVAGQEELSMASPETAVAVEVTAC